MRVFPPAALIVLALLASGCSASDDPSASTMGASDLAAIAAPAAPEVCANHEQGCPCDEPGGLIDCGRVTRRAGDYIWCSSGMQTCSAKHSWGKCTGDSAAATTTGTNPP